MNYRQKRKKAGISLYTMAKELGIDKNKYNELERGKLHLNGDYLDKFMNVLERAKEINFNRLVKIKEVNNWIESGEARIDMEQMGYTQKTLAKTLGVHSSYVNHTLNDINKSSDDFKEEMYDFLHNSLNKNIDKTPTKKKKDKITNNIVVLPHEEHHIETLNNPTITEIPVKIEEEKTEIDRSMEEIDKDRVIEELEKKIRDLEIENKYLKVSLRRLFNI